jgi:hypothetical protein
VEDKHAVDRLDLVGSQVSQVVTGSGLLHLLQLRKDLLVLCQPRSRKLEC